MNDLDLYLMSCDPQRCCDAVRSAIVATAWLLVIVDDVHCVYCVNKLWSQQVIISL